MTVKVRTIGLLRSLFGRAELDVALSEGGTVADLLAALAETFGEQVALHFVEPESTVGHPPLRVMINGRDIAVLGGRQAVLKDGDEILVLTPIAGG
jgi:molybdopterin converting factor small subunit